MHETGTGQQVAQLHERLMMMMTQHPSRKHATVFQAEIYAILACVYETVMQVRPEKRVSICCDSQAALKGPQAP